MPPYTTIGFTLIELLIVITIIGILSVCAYPSYSTYITASRRIDGQTSLLALADKMEQYYFINETYKNASDALSLQYSPDGWYILTITEATDTTYKLQATPRLSQASMDMLCQTLTLTHNGVKAITRGPAGTPTGTSNNCW